MCLVVATLPTILTLLFPFAHSLSFLINLHDLISLLMKDAPWKICFPIFTLLFLELVGEAGDIHSSPQLNERGNSERNFRVSETISVDP